ncbi:T9SS type A sorting domain-containing protein [Winogradskyella alexanderae]|uniref:T9SS type A sorting domain-containing protein n=1 Tax=Winogradskyella alexanderae TaxID=2877123 RepID=A0ABS7XRY3_9FLAO|nr:T9SS type A sorting domain-containing protein [Winogradskyella alexanderae]MCA0132777.1 T9SS type A sorting domain-containing protein [Winogradskyella alexanderae]
MKSLSPLKDSVFESNNYRLLRHFKFIVVGLFCISLFNFKKNNHVIEDISFFSHIGLVKLQIDNGSSNFRTDIYFNTNASLGLDPGYDASLFGGVAPSFSIYSLLVEQNTGMPMGIQALGENDMNGTIVPIGIHALAGDTISVAITENTISPSINIYLEDTAEGTLTLLNSNSYQFVVQDDISSSGRFFLRFGADVLNIPQSQLSHLSIYSDANSNEIIISGYLQHKTSMYLYNINGQLLDEFKLDASSDRNTISSSNLSSGFYIVKITDDIGNIRTEKLIVK